MVEQPSRPSGARALRDRTDGPLPRTRARHRRRCSAPARVCGTRPELAKVGGVGSAGAIARELTVYLSARAKAVAIADALTWPGNPGPELAHGLATSKLLSERCSGAELAARAELPDARTGVAPTRTPLPRGYASTRFKTWTHNRRTNFASRLRRLARAGVRHACSPRLRSNRSTALWKEAGIRVWVTGRALLRILRRARAPNGSRSRCYTSGTETAPSSAVARHRSRVPCRDQRRSPTELRGPRRGTDVDS